MGLFDKLKAYLNEDNNVSSAKDEETKNDAKKEKKKGLFTKLKSEKNVVEHKTGETSYKEVSSYDERENIKDVCEQLIDVSYHMEDMKREYKVVTEYLTDIQRFEELPVNIANDIVDTARKIEMLDKNRQTYLQSENLLSLEQYNKIESLEDEVVNTIKNLNEMEMRDSMLKNDMAHLEGEKDDLRYMRNEYSDGIYRLRGVIITILVVFLISVGILAIVAMTTKKSITVYALAVGALAVISFVVAYVRYLDLRSESKMADAKIKRAVSLLNKVKVKFINNTNTLDYIYAKYGVNSSKELEYQWEQYNQMVRDARRYSQANTDFRACCDALIEKLSKIGVKDPMVWPKQTNALIDSREMVEIKHNLLLRRQKIREQIATCDNIKTNAKTILKAAAEGNPALENYIKEMLLSYNLEM